MKTSIVFTVAAMVFLRQSSTINIDDNGNMDQPNYRIIIARITSITTPTQMIFRIDMLLLFLNSLLK